MTTAYHTSRVADALTRASWALAQGDYDRARTEARTAEQHAAMAWQEERERAYRAQEERRRAREEAGAA